MEQEIRTHGSWHDGPIEGERWKDIENFAGYQISDHGRVRSFKGKREGHICKPKITQAGYYYYHLVETEPNRRYRFKSMGASRLVGFAFVENPDPENLFEVDHIDGNKANNHYTNIQWIKHDKNVRKSQAYLWRVSHVDTPDEYHDFNSRALAAEYMGKSMGFITYRFWYAYGKPSRDGWIVQGIAKRGATHNYKTPFKDKRDQ